MTRREQAMIADVVRSFGGRAIRPGTLVRALADAFEQDNPRFDRDRFLLACGVRRRQPNQPKE